jgi:hypothetical protein
MCLRACKTTARLLHARSTCPCVILLPSTNLVPRLPYVDRMRVVLSVAILYIHYGIQYTVHAQGTAIYTQLSRQSTSSIRYPGRSPGFHGRMPGLPCSTIPAPSLLLRSLPRRTSGRCPACIPTGRGPLSMSDCGPRLPTTCGIAMSSAMEVRL